jgi:uncharacterized membrane protein
MFCKGNLNIKMSDKLSFADWLLELPVKVFLWGLMGVLFGFWLIAMLVVICFVYITNH